MWSLDIWWFRYDFNEKVIDLCFYLVAENRAQVLVVQRLCTSHSLPLKHICTKERMRWSNHHRCFSHPQLDSLALLRLGIQNTPETCGDLKWQALTAESTFSCSCAVRRRWEGAAEEIHQPLLPAGQGVPSARVARPRGHPAGLFLWSALNGGRAQCECVCVYVWRGNSSWAALRLGWQSPRSSNPLDPPSISFRALGDYQQIRELSPGLFVSLLCGSYTQARWARLISLLKTLHRMAMSNTRDTRDTRRQQIVSNERMLISICRGPPSLFYTMNRQTGRRLGSDFCPDQNLWCCMFF